MAGKKTRTNEKLIFTKVQRNFSSYMMEFSKKILRMTQTSQVLFNLFWQFYAIFEQMFLGQ